MRAGVDQVDQPAGRRVLGLVAGDRERPAVGREVEIPDDAVTQPIRLAHRQTAGRVHEGHDARAAAVGHQPAVRAHGGGPELQPVARQLAERERVAHQRREQVAPRRGGVVERRTGACQQQRLVEALAVERLGADPLGVGRHGGFARLPALGDRDDTRRGRQGEQGSDSGQQDPQAAIRAPLALALQLRLRAARGDERALEPVQLGLVPLGPVKRGSQPGAAVELRRVAACRQPAAGRAHEVQVQPASVGVLLEPRPQSGPLAQQRLMRDLHLSLADRDQPRLGEDVEDLRDRVALELAQLGAASHDGVALALSGQPQQDPPGQQPACGVKPLVGLLGLARDRPADSPGLLVRRPAAGCCRRGAATAPAAPTRPAAAHRAGPRRRRRSASTSSRSTRRPARRAGSSIARRSSSSQHRPDEHVAGAQEPRQLRVRGAAAVVVGAHGDDDQCAPAHVPHGRHERVDERRAL